MRTPASQKEDVRAVLDAIVGRVAPGLGIAGVAQGSSLYATTARLSEIELRVTDGTTMHLIHKQGGRVGRLSTAAGATPRFLYDPMREISVYERLLARQKLDTPVLYASHVEPRRGRYWLFLERVPGTQLRWAVDPAAWQRTGAWLAHAHVTLQADAERNGSWLLVHDAAYYRRWLGRARALTESGDHARRTRLAWLARHYEELVERLVSLPRTVIHGEFYPSNILVDESTADGRISVVDWEMAALGPAVIDLAALMGGRLTPPEQDAILESYRKAMPAHASGLAETARAETLACAKLHFAIQWLGWARGWSPPAEQTHDWLAEAVELGEAMGW